MEKGKAPQFLTLTEQVWWNDLFEDFESVASDDAIEFYRGLFKEYCDGGQPARKNEADKASYAEDVPRSWGHFNLAGNVEGEDMDLIVEPLDKIKLGFENFLRTRGKYHFFTECVERPELCGDLYFDQLEVFYDDNFEGLTHLNKEGVQTLKLEIQDRERFGCTEIQFALIIAHLKKLYDQFKATGGRDPLEFDWWSSVPDNVRHQSGVVFTPTVFRNLFRAGLTDFGPSFVNHIPDLQIRRAILESLEFAVDDSEDEDEEPIDVRIWDHMQRVKWYLDTFNLPPLHQNTIFKVVLSMEPPYRNRMRNKEVSQSDPTRPEPHFSHFLRVLRIGLGLIDSVRKKNYRLEGDLAHMFDDLYTDETQTEIDPDNLLSYCIELLTHDLEEDWKITGISNPQQVKAFLRDLIPTQYPKKAQLLERVAFTSHALNSKHYDSREQSLRVLRSDLSLARIKLPDMLQNHSSPYTNKKEKLRMYSDRFLAKFCNQGLVHIVPDRLMISALAQNPVLPEAGVVWAKVQESITNAYATDDIQSLADRLSIPLAQSDQEMFY
ncbi:hypothetical protein GW756_00850 [bacterium]|nr:hypothetical protein [bacterium]NCQ54906.1 hypothetical protein [Candidatus Parcubacteria bacterium]NCS66950.1 hypothetical protein [Candidatus Peregrinibacteria bacterium]NCS95897.1 hypothetical protein [bacterium]